MESDKETKSDRFIRIAEARTNKIINMIESLGNCANRNAYDYSKEDVKKIFNAIESELKITKSKFDTENDKKEKFSLH